MKSTVIRPYQPSDKKHLVKIFNLNTPKYFDKGEVIDFEKYLKQRADTYLVTELNNEIVGGAGYYINNQERSGHITWIFFNPKYSGQGLGREIVAYCLSILENDERVHKFVVTTSQLAYRFFEKFGYSLSRTEKDYWGKGLDLYEIEMLKK